MLFSSIGNDQARTMGWYSFGCTVAMLDIVFAHVWPEIYEEQRGDKRRCEFSTSFKEWCVSNELPMN